MIQGQINADNEAVIPLRIRSANGQEIDFDAVIDTGFSGYVTLPPATIATLQLPFQQRQTYVLGDNSQVQFDVYLATVVWDGQARDIAVLAADGGVLVGMRMLRGYQVFLDVIDGGDVRIELRPQLQVSG